MAVYVRDVAQVVDGVEEPKNAALLDEKPALALEIQKQSGANTVSVADGVLDAVQKAQGQGCAPGILGVAIGGDRGSSYYTSKEVLFRQLDDTNADPELADLERRLTEEANQLGIGPMGFGGQTTLLGTKITSLNRLPASFFVSVSYMCWAYRRRKMVWKDGAVSYS